MKANPMKYLVVQRRGNCPAIRVLGSDTVITDRFESWALDTGKRVLTVESVLPRKLRPFHIGGSFSGYAMYGMDYEQLVLVLTELMGETDRQRYERLRTEQDKMTVQQRRHADVGRKRRWELASQIGVTVLIAMIKMLIIVIKAVGFLILFPMLLHFISKGRSRH